MALEPIQPIRPEGGGQPTAHPTPPVRPPEAALRTDQLQLAPARLSFSQAENGDIIVRVFDGGTGKLIRQIPPPEQLRVAARIRMILERLKE